MILTLALAAGIVSLMHIWQKRRANYALNKCMTQNDLIGAKKALQSGADPNTELLSDDNSIHNLRQLWDRFLGPDQPVSSISLLAYLVESGAHNDNNYDKIALLLSYGADTNQIVPFESGNNVVVEHVHLLNYRSEDDSPLTTSSFKTLKLLVDHGADINADECRCLTGAVAHNNSDIAEWLIKRGARPTIDKNNYALCAAVHNANPTMVRLILDAGAPADRLKGSHCTWEDWRAIVGNHDNNKPAEHDVNEVLNMLRERLRTTRTK